MKNKQAVQPYAKDADNLELLKLTTELAGHGLSQQDIAGLLGISPGQLSRVKKGERRAAWKHVRALREQVQRLKREQTGREMHSAARPASVSIDRAVLRGLSSTTAVEAFRDLLWARAGERGIPVTRVSISADVSTPDGGVDASILEGAGAKFQDDELFSSGRRFQIKTGDFQPWQPGTIKRELFGTKAKKFNNLGPAIQRTLREGNELVLVCFGVDPVDEKLRKAKENLAAAFKACGFPNARVDVWGQTQLIGLFQQYPSLCLRLRGHDHQGFRFWSSWAADADMQSPIHYSPEQFELVEELRGALQSGQLPHIRLLGEPGVGKTRMALELTRADNLAPVTLYLRDGRALLKSSFLNELIQDHAYHFVVLVVDECPQKDSAEIWNILRTRSEKVRLVTIDHGPDTSADDKMRIVHVDPAGPEQILSILEEYGIGKHDAGRWAEYCQGCPRVAHVIGENLRQNRADVLQSPATVNLWDRFIVGHDEPNSEKVQLRKIVLRYVSLFERFGFEPPVDAEAQFIASMAEACDSRLKWPRFQSLIANLKQRRIIQGATTLYITPRLLHMHLYRDFWRSYGSGFDIASALQKMPGQIRQWFIAMLKYADDSPVAQAAVENLLGPRGLVPGGAFPDDQATGQMLRALAEASAKPTLRCLQRIIGKANTSELHEIREARQYLVWTLERLAVWNDCFTGSAELLLRLAEAENSTNGNNATGTFIQLFSLVPGLAATQATASQRNDFLRDALDSNSAPRRRIALAAARSALSTRGGLRMVGPEHQGLRKTIEFWYPKTHDELWDAYRDVWEMLVAKLTTWQGEERSALIQTIIASAGLALHIPPLASAVLQTLESLVDDAEANLKGLVGFIGRELKFRKKELEEDTAARLAAIRVKLDGHDFKSKLRRYVKYATTDDGIDDNYQRRNVVDEKLEELAREGIASPALLNAELTWLMREDSSRAFCLAFRLGNHDPARGLLPALLKVQESLREEAATSFLSGYLASIYEQNAGEWESLILSLANKPFVETRFADLAISSGMSDTVARKVADSCRSGLLDARCLEQWWYRDRLHQVSEPVFLELVDLQLVENRPDLWSNAVNMFHTYYLAKETQRKLPNEPTFRVLTSPSMVGEWAGSTVSYYWSRLAAAFVAQYAERTWEFFRAVLRLGIKQWNLMADLDMSEEQVLARLFRNNPEQAWDCIAEVVAEEEVERAFEILHWLGDSGLRLPGDNGPGLMQFAPSDKVFAWVDGSVAERGRWLINALPKTLDHTPAGRLTRDFIARYGKNESLSSSLGCHFHARSWCGSASAYYHKLREQAREWLVGEKNQTVVRWIENYIDGLGYDIQRAEIEEERRF
jgi:hypothetical protein